ncbi:hypothetical protein PVK06_048665 [Gossypium arboreum]|uniref:Uncharacterized protein n=1 Tax=Gossypium arboreum TaxID=29729 RepID=A0ABR0MGG8_GOSAR|nr:hypothetical protein PVK06_048665 [Gossypium arboreum]
MSQDCCVGLNCNIFSQFKYTPSYCKAWIAKQKALEKMQSGWDDSYNKYCKPLVQIDGTFMYGRYTHHLLLAVAQDRDRRTLPIAFSITPGELDCGSGILAARYELNKDRFHGILGILRLINDQDTNYLYNIPFDQWTQSYDVDLRYGQMTSNLPNT